MKYRGVEYNSFQGDEYNAMYAAFCENAGSKDKDILYTWIEETPIATMTVFLVDKLKEMGFEIRKI